MSVSTSVGEPRRRVLLARHGHYERPVGGGDTTWGLSPLGHRQSVRLGRRLSRVLEAYEGTFEGMYASPWPRGLQTAEAAAREMDLPSIKVKPYLHETAAWVSERTPCLELAPELPRVSDVDQQAAHDQVERVRERFLAPSDSPHLVVLVTHGNLIRYLVARCLGLPYEAWTQLDICHCSLTELRVYPSGAQVLSAFNETGHLPLPMVTSR